MRFKPSLLVLAQDPGSGLQECLFFDKGQWLHLQTLNSMEDVDLFQGQRAVKQQDPERGLGQCHGLASPECSG